MKSLETTRPPWEDSPYSLVSLLDMLIFYAGAFLKVVSWMEHASSHAHIYKDNPQGCVDEVCKDLIILKHECKRLALDSIVAQIERVHTRVLLSRKVAPDGSMHGSLTPLLGEISDSIKHEFSKHLFLHVAIDRKGWYREEDQPCLFGAAVAGKFPKAIFHIGEAGRCFALERWDACVHHLMLAVEEALRKWAKSMKLTTKGPIHLENWETILQAAQTKLNSIKTAPKSTKNDKDKKRLSEPLAHFDLIKHAFRVHCAHGRELYDERRTKIIMGHVDGFMESLTKIV